MDMPLLIIIALTIFGVILIVVDLLFIPGGLLVALGAMAILYGVYVNYNEFGLVPAFIHLLVCLAMVPKLVTWSLARVSLKKELTSEEGYVANSRASFIGSEAVAASDLRPSGSVMLLQNGEELHLDCIAEGGFIEKGQAVVISAERGPSLVVRRH